jgi:uncharacterized protein with von Willebrand factor type A (vWA) domain
LANFIGGGSDLDVPVREHPRMYRQLGAPVGDTDVLLITDYLCRVPEEFKNRSLNWKRAARARAITLVVNGAPGDLAEVSDEVHLVQSLAVAEPAVERVLSL